MKHLKLIPPLFAVLTLSLTLSVLLTYAQDDDPASRIVINAENATSLTRIAQLVGHGSAINDLAFSPNGALLASVSDDVSVRLWKPDERAQTAEVYPHASFVRRLAFSPLTFGAVEDESERFLMASTSWDRTVILYDVTVATNAITAQEAAAGYNAIVEPVTFSPDGSLLAVGVGDGTAHIFNVATLENLALLELDGLQVITLVFNPTGNLLATATGFPDDSVQIWGMFESEDDESEFEVDLVVALADVGLVSALIFHPELGTDDESILFIAGTDGLLGVWALNPQGTPSFINEVSADQDDWYTSLSINPSGTLLAGGTIDGEVLIWDIRNADAPQFITRLDAETIPVNTVRFSPDGSRLVTGGGDGIIRIWGITDDQGN